MFKNIITGIGGAIAGAVAVVSIQAQNIEDKFEEWKAANLASFIAECPYKRAGLSNEEYERAWHQVYPHGFAVSFFAKNHGITKDEAATCFTDPKAKAAK